MTFSPFKKLSFTQSSPMTTAVVAFSLVAVGTAIYLSPAGGKHTEATANAAPRPTIAPLSTTSATPSAAAVAKTTAAAKAKAKATAAAKARQTYGGTQPDVIHAPGKTDVVVVHQNTNHNSTQIVHEPGATVTTTAGAKPTQLQHCSSFKWQQDAQAVYVANLSDPGALDGAAGPHNGDGIACNQLPVDPSRPASVPVDAYVAPTPTAASKAALVEPAAKYFGVTQDGLPGDASMFDKIAALTGKAPSQVGWFSGFDSDYGSAQVTEAWSRGALPMITWMSVASTPGSGHDSSEYTLSKIASGADDAYLTKYAGDIVRTNLPVVIRFDHEMNGNWYPWSAGLYHNTPALYVAAWQHIWNVFQSVGANDDVIWLWAPTRIDNLKPDATTGGGVGQTGLGEDYPGDQYVDWIGASMYLRVPKTGPTYAATFGKTIGALESLTNKPIFIPETAAVESDTSGTDVGALKAQWIANAFSGFLADPRIVGFSWFNNVKTTADGVTVANDWKIDSSPGALAAFKDGIATPDFSSGTLPDGL